MLMIPGPSEPEPEALAVLSMPIMPHYGKEWGEYYYETLAKLKKIFKTRKGDVLIFPTPGQVAVEVAAENLVRKKEEAFVCSNGFFSEMIQDIITSHGARPHPIKKDLGEAVTLDDVKQELEDRKDLDGECIFIVHNETSTGITNPVADIVRWCKREKGMLTILDCISSFGGIDIRMDDWGVDFCVGYASKALGAVFGVVPIALSVDAWNTVKRNADGINGRFMNLNRWLEFVEKWGAIGHPHPSTMPTSVIAAMNKAVDIALAEGLNRRYERHAKVASMMRDGLESMGLEIFPDKKYTSNTVSVARIDARQDKLVRQRLQQEYNIMIGGGIGELEGKIIRIGHMGTSATIPKVAITLESMRSILTGIPKRKTKKR